MPPLRRHRWLRGPGWLVRVVGSLEVCSERATTALGTHTCQPALPLGGLPPTESRAWLSQIQPITMKKKEAGFFQQDVIMVK